MNVDVLKTAMDGGSTLSVVRYTMLTGTNIGSVQLTFSDAGLVCISVDPDTDEIIFQRQASAGGTRDASGRSPWSDTIGKPLLSFWAMENQMGYSDGIQLCFAHDVTTESTTTQLIAAASSILVHSVSLVPGC